MSDRLQRTVFVTELVRCITNAVGVYSRAAMAGSDVCAFSPALLLRVLEEVTRGWSV